MITIDAYKQMTTEQLKTFATMLQEAYKKELGAYSLADKIANINHKDDVITELLLFEGMLYDRYNEDKEIISYTIKKLFVNCLTLI